MHLRVDLVTNKLNKLNNLDGFGNSVGVSEASLAVRLNAHELTSSRSVFRIISSLPLHA
jgi:type II secretory pathway component PulC